LWTPIAVLMFVTFAMPKITRKSTGLVVMLIGGTFGVLSLLFPQLVIAKQAVFGTMAISILLVIITAIFDKRPSNIKALYGKELKELEEEEKAAV